LNDDTHDEQLSQLYRQSRIEEPPMALDAAVLSAARQAVEKQPRWRLSGWLLPLGSVAVVMLAATLLIQMRHEHPEVMAPQLEAPAGRSMEDAAKARRADEAMPAREKKAVAPAIAPAPASPASGILQAPKAQPLLKEERRAVESFQAAPAAGGNALPEKAAEADRMAPATLQSAPAANEKILYPESWIAKIRQLLKQGDKDAARRESEAFRAAYPDQPLPDDIVKALQ